MATQYATEFAGNYKTVTVLVDAGTRTNTVSIDGISTIRGIQATLAEAPTANAALIEVTHNGGNIAAGPLKAVVIHANNAVWRAVY